MSERIAENTRSGVRAAVWGWLVWYFTPFSGFLFTVLDKDIFSTLDPANIESFIVGTASALGITGGVGAYYRDKKSPTDYRPAQPLQPQISQVEVPAIAPFKSKWRYGKRSRDRLSKAHNDLQRVFERGLELSVLDITITETEREESRQSQLIDEGKSSTMNSRHLERPAMAVDHAPLVDGKVVWDMWAFEKTTDALKQAATELGVDCDFGIDWKTFKDGPHVQLSRKMYPKITPDIKLA